MFIPLIFRTRETSARRVIWSTGMICLGRSDWRTRHDHVRKTEGLGEVLLATSHGWVAARDVELFGEVDGNASLSVPAQRGKRTRGVAQAPRVMDRYSRFTAPRRFRIRDGGPAGSSVWPCSRLVSRD